MALRPAIPEPHRCGDPTCTDDHDERPGLALQLLDGRGAE